ncbi:hypothetical protein [Pseudobacteriovorax antillogorgiicola]|uniref:Plastid lipid-associated protein/fibrillin conserved domain-containing protein n=1 Tax=Pseudobacteriovorax antillogorgiicola TaxID=1513793 RepID=A0A1Y6C491_9BACT|nr:hypothetical protein [Pseudobacteriovorax antillogorgiicola]TCS49769.1 hypothetical protein EDD56_11414 [Pseudobacteriovorax antillogorgiicola]SMF42723.1 hypothetical protein SAMN06296036_11313 [Pseudobacteriovorax antillogorgiicola]
MRFMGIVASLSLLLVSAPALSKGDKPSRIDVLKGMIVAISKDNTANMENRLEVRNQLDPLVNELLELSPSQTEGERASLVAGAWKSLWSDQSFGFGVDYQQVYQVVSEDGYYYNISKVQGPEGVFTNFLRGAYESQGSYLAIEFTANELSPGFFPAKTQLVNLAEDFEAGLINSFSIPGPIGVTGVLMNIYVDDELRLVYGNSVSDTRPRLFVLERTQAIEK